MRIVVLGAGVVGATAAFYLARAGHEVTVVERRAAAGLETSFANAGHLCRTTARPWTSPAVPAMILREFGRIDAPFLLRLRLDPRQWIWGVRFLSRCRPSSFRQAMAALDRLARYSAAALDDLQRTTPVAFDLENHGLLHIFREAKSFDAAAQSEATYEGSGAELLDVDGCVAREPAFAASRDRLAGGIFFRDEQTGDAHAFSQAIAGLGEEAGVSYRYGVAAHGLSLDGNKVAGVATDGGEIPAEAVVVSMGSYSPLFLRPYRVRLPIYPVKGYSATLSTRGFNGAPKAGIQDGSRKIGISRLGERLRVAGTAELVGYDTNIDDRRAHAVLDHAMALFPNAADPSTAKLWTGLRPMTPDCLPCIGRTPIDGLFLNTGHGSLGWTLACGSARALAEQVSGRKPEVDVEAFDMRRF